MTKVYGTGTYDFRRHRVAEYPLAEPKSGDQSQKGGGGGGLQSTITVSEIQRDRLTKIAESNWLKTDEKKKDFDPELVVKIYETELLVKEGQGNKPVPLQRVMILEVSQYLENYLWPHFDPLSATFEHVMSIIIMVNEKFRENVAAWVCFHDKKDVFKEFLERVIRLKEGRELNIAEKTNYLVFMINAFQHMDNAYPGSNILVVTLTNGESKRVEAQSNDDTLREAMAVLRDMFGPDIPDAIDILVPRWFNNRFQRGSYSNYPIIANRKNFHNIKAPVGHIFFTGEHTSERFNGYVHGGYLAGIDTGKALVEEIRKENERESENQTLLLEPLLALTGSLTMSKPETVSNIHKCDIPTQLYLSGKLGIPEAIL